MRVLVTGGSGSLGSEVVAELGGRGHEARPASEHVKSTRSPDTLAGDVPPTPSVKAADAD